MTTTLITGGTRGLGRESARRLVEAGHTVYLGARDARRGREVAEEVGARPLVLDVLDDASTEAAAERVREQSGHLDVLINNAGIPGPVQPAGRISAQDVREVYETNVFGVVRVTRAFLPLLELADAPRVLNISSGLASFARWTGPAGVPPQDGPYLAYASAKAALNMLTVHYAGAYPGMRFTAVNPGPTATGLNVATGTQTLQEGTAAIVAVACDDGPGPTGTFLAAQGPLPW